MNFIVTDREAVEQGLLVRQPYVLISICDPRKRSPRLPKSGLCGGILRLRFHDATPVAGFELPDEIKADYTDMMYAEDAEEVRKKRHVQRLLNGAEIARVRGQGVAVPPG
ncbi:hypothetical protein LCGC14_2039000, partial [marine sediment metagenome]